MTEIIIAIILQISTILGGVPTDKSKADNNEKSAEKAKTEKDIKGSGGTGVWED